jgi:hypothetical protein
MRLSPWEPARFLWAAVEGVCGLVLTPGPPKINPLIPVDWSWVALRNVPYQGSAFSYFLIRDGDAKLRTYVTRQIDRELHAEVYERDVTNGVRVSAEGVAVVALWRNSGIIVLVGNTAGETVHAPINITDTTLLPVRATLRVFNSERRNWEKRRVGAAGDLSGLALTIEAGGFRLLEISSLSVSSK